MKNLFHAFNFHSDFFGVFPGFTDGEHQQCNHPGAQSAGDEHDDAEKEIRGHHSNAADNEKNGEKNEPDESKNPDFVTGIAGHDTTSRIALV